MSQYYTLPLSFVKILKHDARGEFSHGVSTDTIHMAPCDPGIPSPGSPRSFNGSCVYQQNSAITGGASPVRYK